MTDTTHGGVTLIDAGQDDKEVTANAAFERLTDKIDQGITIPTADANVTLTATQQQDNGWFEFDGAMTAGRTVTFLASQHKSAKVYNNTTGGFDLTFGYAAGASVVASPGEIFPIQGDGTDFFQVGAAGGGAGRTNSTVQTTDATPTTLFTVAVATDTEIQIDMPIGFAHQLTTNDTLGIDGKCWAKNVAGTVTISRKVKGIGGDAGTAAWTFDFVVSTTNVICQVTGEAAHTIDWESEHEVVVR